MKDELSHCVTQAALCAAASCDESLTTMDRVGATIGELDWLSEKLAVEKEYRYPDFWDDAARVQEEERKRLGEEERKLAAYDAFVRSKVNFSKTAGFEVEDSEIHPILKSHQRICVRWMVRGGRRALFASFGLGKTIIQIEALRLICERAGGRALIVAPLGVRAEFIRDAENLLGLEIRFVRTIEECGETGIYITNYETVRDGKLDPNHFVVTTLDEASCLRSGGSSKTFREFMRLFEGVKYRFVATATPSPNDLLEILVYSAYLGIMDIGEAKTRYFKRNSTQADNLTLRHDKEEEFYLWRGTWSLTIQKPSDICACADKQNCRCDDGYVLPELIVTHHEVKANHEVAVSDKDGQMRFFRNSSMGVVDAAREKRDSLHERIAAAKLIIDANPNDHFILWHDLEAERHAIQQAIPEAISVWGTQDMDEREDRIADFSIGKFRLLSTKPELAGSGCNFQRFCHKAIFVGIGFKFNDFIQSIHRVQRFLQGYPVEIHLIYCESERDVLKTLLRKWELHNKSVETMTALIKEYGLSELALAQAMTRSIGTERIEVKGKNYTLVHNDSVVEAIRSKHLPDNSVGLILTSIPFSTQYEYTPSYNDFGHSEDNAQFFEQMDFLTPELYRALMPGRIAAIHVKDRTVPGGINGYGFQSAYPFHCHTILHFEKHGFVYLGMKTIVTDVVRENNQTYRLGWTEQCKDGSKMGVGMPEYLLLFRKPQTDTTKGYADIPISKDKKRYSKARWQVDAHGFTRSDGNRLLDPHEIRNLTHQKIFGMFHDYYLHHVYNFEHHVQIGELLDTCVKCGHVHSGNKRCGATDCDCRTAAGRLPVTFMLLQPPSWHPEVWTDITRMLTANLFQAQKGRIAHLCPMQFDLADRVINQMSNPGDLILDPFSGLGTVPFRAVALGRKGYGVELNPAYFAESIAYCKAAEEKIETPTLFDMLETESAQDVA